MSEFDEIGHDPANTPAGPPRSERHGRKPKDNGANGQAQEKSDARIIELAKIETAPAPNILGGPAPNPFAPALLRIDKRDDTVALKREVINLAVRRFEPFRTHRHCAPTSNCACRRAVSMMGRSFW
jgi:hypothetical protein